MIVIIIAIFILGTLFDYFVSFEPSTYFSGKYNTLIIDFLILYKLVELPIVYYILMYRHIISLRKNQSIISNFDDNNKFYSRLKKHTKLLYFLIPQGNVVFGIIAYKVSSEILYFYLFLSIALVSLIIIKPSSLNGFKLK